MSFTLMKKLTSIAAAPMKAEVVKRVRKYLFRDGPCDYVVVIRLTLSVAPEVVPATIFLPRVSRDPSIPLAPPVSSFPPELMLQVYEMCDPITQVSLGLICNYLYHEVYLKKAETWPLPLKYRFDGPGLQTIMFMQVIIKVIPQHLQFNPHFNNGNGLFVGPEGDKEMLAEISSASVAPERLRFPINEREIMKSEKAEEK
jgi:hypothetical protein